MNRTYRIVVGVNGSEGSTRALEWAVTEAANRGGSVQAVMTYDWSGTEAAMLAGIGPEGEARHAADVLARVVAAVTAAHPAVPVAAEVMYGEAAAQLTRAACGADLLVVGSRGHGRLHHAVLGSVSESCIRLACCPVVVIPAPHAHKHPHPAAVPAVVADQAATAEA